MNQPSIQPMKVATGLRGTGRQLLAQPQAARPRAPDQGARQIQGVVTALRIAVAAGDLLKPSLLPRQDLYTQRDRSLSPPVLSDQDEPPHRAVLARAKARTSQMRAQRTRTDRLDRQVRLATEAASKRVD